MFDVKVRNHENIRARVIATGELCHYIILIDFINQSLTYNDKNGNSSSLPINSFKMERVTKLTDCNGHFIYEGDVLEKDERLFYVRYKEVNRRWEAATEDGRYVIHEHKFKLSKRYIDHEAI